MSKSKQAFYSGIITCLSIIVIHDQQTMYEEIINALDLQELIRVAWLNDELEFSGLIKYGYADEKGAIINGSQ